MEQTIFCCSCAKEIEVCSCCKSEPEDVLRLKDPESSAIEEKATYELADFSVDESLASYVDPMGHAAANQPVFAMSYDSDVLSYSLDANELLVTTVHVTEPVNSEISSCSTILTSGISAGDDCHNRLPSDGKSYEYLI
jgi:hypothetical protein